MCRASWLKDVEQLKKEKKNKITKMNTCLCFSIKGIGIVLTLKVVLILMDGELLQTITTNVVRNAWCAPSRYTLNFCFLSMNEWINQQSISGTAHPPLKKYFNSHNSSLSSFPCFSWINHSKNHPNCIAYAAGPKDKPIVIMQSTRHIVAGEFLRWDYGMFA